MKKILVPTDFSDCALNALKQATVIAKKSGAVIDLVHLGMEGNADALNKLNEITKLDFISGIEINKHHFDNVEMKKMFQIEAINNPDLIVMGTHGTTGTKTTLMGSNAANIILSANVPVLVTKEHQTLSLSNVVFASNFDPETEESFKDLQKLIQQEDTTIHLLFVIIPSFFATTAMAEGKMEAFAKKMGIKNYTINVYNDKTIETGIHNFSKKINADLISMETHGRKGLAHFFSGSITEDVVNHADLPVLSMRIKTIN